MNAAGQLYTWGYNYYGQLGNGSVTDRLWQTFIGSGYSAVFAGPNQTFALQADTRLYAAGYNFQGALGVGDFTSTQSAHTTFQGVGFGSTGWQTVAPGKWHAIARKADGTIWSWGYGSEGQKGTGNLTPTAVPGQIGSLATWTAVSSADDTGFAAQGTTVYSWGLGGLGSLGDGTTTNRLTLGPSMAVWEPYQTRRPYTLGSFDGVQSVSVTYRDSLGGTVRLSDSIIVDVVPPTVSASMQYGDWITNSLTVAVMVYPSADAVSIRVNGGPWGSPAVVAPSNVALATLAGGDGAKTITVEAMDAGGNVGTATTGIQLDRTAPTGTMSVNGGSGISRFLTTGVDSNVGTASFMRHAEERWASINGGGHLMAIRADGTLWGLGDNAGGQIGDGTTAGDAGAFNPTDREQLTRTSGAYKWTYVDAAAATLAIRDDGTLWSWGTNASGILGTGDATSRSVPGPVSGGGTWRTVSAASHALAIKDDGTLWAWGPNSRGQLGDGTTSTRLAPVQIGAATDWVAVAAGTECSFGIKTDGSLWAWGWNYSARTGLGINANSNTLTPTRIGADSDWASVAPSAGSAFGAVFGIATKTDGSLWSWGTDSRGGLGQGESVSLSIVPARVGGDNDWAAIAAGGDAAYAVKDSGSLWGWGDDGSFAFLGMGGLANRVWAPTRIGTESDWRAVSPTSTNVYGLTTEGVLKSWGYATRCAHGQTSRRTVTAPVLSGWRSYAASFPLVLPDSPDPTSVTMSYRDPAGNQLTLSTAVTYAPDTPVWMTLDGGAATATDTSFLVEPTVPGSATMRLGRRWQGVHAGDGYTVLHIKDGPVEFAGYGSLGQRGSSDLTYRTSSYVYGGETRVWRDFDTGDGHSLALAADGTLWAWGSNDHGEAGAAVAPNVPKPAMLTPSQRYTRVFAGLHSSFAIRSDGTLWAWGNNSSGELGDGTTTSRPAPVQVGVDTDWAEISNWGGHTLALKTDGSLWAWGPNASYQLGLGDTAARLNPTRIGVATGWKDISAAQTHSAAIAANGSLWTWGANGNGQLGDGSTTTRVIPVLVSGDAWKLIDTGVKCTLGIKQDGTLWAWGDNSSGQLGDGSSTQRTSPVRIGARSDWELVDAGGSPEWTPVLGGITSVGATADGTLYTWGEGVFGQLGDGTYTATDILTPTERVRSSRVPYAASSVLEVPWASGETTVNACFIDGAGNITWLSDTIFTRPAAPVISRVTPADGDVAESATPEISAHVDVAAGGMPATLEVRVDGTLIPSTFDYGATNTLRAPTAGLGDDRFHTAEIRVTDAGGTTVTSTTTFLVEGGPKMPHWSAKPDCRTCHGAAVPHDGAAMDGNESSCLVCHMGVHSTQVEQPLPRYYNCYCHTSGADPRYLNWTHKVDPAKCLTCHTKYSTGLDPDKRETVTHITDASACRPCHRSELRFEHSLRTNHLGVTLNCKTCHDSTDPIVQTAITSNDKRCATCHPGVDHWADHAQPPLPAPCSSCHVPNLLTEHKDRGVVCDTCHRSSEVTVVTAIAAGNGSCDACHAASITKHPANGMQPVDRTRCSTCHWSVGTVGAGLGDIHSHSSMWLDPTASCLACHPTRSVTRIFTPPPVEGPYGAFATAGSAASSADDVHRIHTKGSPALGAAASASYCDSCHGAAACDTCHGAVPHSDHAYRVATGSYVAPPVTMTVAPGVLPGATVRKTTRSRAVTCIGSGCHELSTAGSVVASPDCARCHS